MHWFAFPFYYYTLGTDVSMRFDILNSSSLLKSHPFYQFLSSKSFNIVYNITSLRLFLPLSFPDLIVYEALVITSSIVWIFPEGPGQRSVDLNMALRADQENYLAQGYLCEAGRVLDYWQSQGDTKAVASLKTSTQAFLTTPKRCSIWGFLNTLKVVLAVRVCLVNNCYCL